MKSWIPCHTRAAALLLLAALPPAFAQTTPTAQLPSAPPAPVQDLPQDSAPLPAPLVPLTMDQAVAAAIAHNPALLSAEQNLLSMHGQEVQAGARQNPDFSFYGSNVTLPGAGNEGNPYQYSLQVSRLFERGQKRRWRVEGAQDTTQQTEAQYRDQKRLLVFNVRSAFTNLLLAKAALKLAQDNLHDYRRELDINHKRYVAGDIAKIDYERLDLQLAQFETDEATALQNLVQASDQLQTLIGYPQPRRDFDIVGDLVPPVLQQKLPALEQSALASRPDYQAAQAAVRVADANIKMQYANGTTDPTLEGEYDRSGYWNSWGFEVTIPIRIFDRNQGNKETAKFQAQSSRFSLVAARNQVFSDVDQAWVGYTTSKELSDRYNGHYLAEAKDVLSIAQFAYQHGGLALIDYLDALQDYRSTASDALNAYAQTWLAIHQLSYSSATNLVP